MLKKLQTTGVAAALTACLVLASALMGANLSLSRMRQQCVDLFYYGDDGSYRGINYDLVEIRDNSENLATVALRYLEPDDDRIAQVERAAGNMVSDDSGYGARHEAAVRLQTALEQLDGALAETALSQQDQAYRKKLMANIEAHYETIEKSGYNQAATEFNRELSAFPANILGGLTGIRPLELYE